MENLTASVYECTLAVEAHMVCDLLTRAGIPARVDGEFLTGAGGDLPLNTVRVRVEPSRAIEAREVIADWEKSQPREPSVSPLGKPRIRSSLWFLVGVAAGCFLMVIVLNARSPIVDGGVDYNGDGRADTLYRYSGNNLSMTEMDRNLDGMVDARWKFDSRGLETHYEADDDFDGRFEWQAEVEYGEISRNVLDTDGDGRPEQVWHSEHGVLRSVDYHFASGGRVVKREHFRAGLLDHAEYDDDGDGVFERSVSFDRQGERVL
jgi:hypothetical protein